MNSRHDSVVHTLNDIVSCIVEYDLHLESTRLISFIDLYRAYRESFSDSNNQSQSHSSPVSYREFIFDQALLNLAASIVSQESGESTAPPKALEFSNPD